MDEREGQWADFALQTTSDGYFTYTCGWCNRILHWPIWQRKKGFQDAVAVHCLYNCDRRTVLWSEERMWADVLGAELHGC